MDIIIVENKGNGTAKKVSGTDSYKESLKKMLYAAVGNALDEETQRANHEMIEERRKAINQIAEENKTAIKQIVEDEKKAIWEEAIESQQSETSVSDAIKDQFAQASMPDKLIISRDNGGKPVSEIKHDTPVFMEHVEVEILPPRDQKEIDIINECLYNLSGIKNIELVTLVDRSIFKVELSKPVDLIKKLGSLPQVSNVEEVIDNGKKKIVISLSVKARMEKNQNEMNAKVNKIFYKKKN
jgi:hypothetical protein